MNNDMLRRRIMRDRRREDYNRNSDYAREDMRYRKPFQYSNEYTVGGYAMDHNAKNRYTPRGFDMRESDYRRGDMAYSGSDNTRYGDNAMRDSRYDGHYSYPFEVAGRFAREPYPFMDHSSGEARLSNRELHEWTQRLMEMIDEKDKQSFNKEHVIKKAEDLGIEFEKFTKEEFHATVLMLYTDFCKTLGIANFDLYLRLAKDWLCDEDPAVRYGEKLAAYHDAIVEGM